MPIVAFVVSGCAASTAPDSALAATPAVAPDVPPDWIVTSSEDGSVSLAVPPDLIPTALPREVLAQAPMAAAGFTPIEIWAIGSPGAQPQPRGGEPLRGWLEAASWVPRAGQGGVTAVGDVEEGEVLLPAGRAYRVAITAQPGTPEASRVIAYAIATERGFAVLRMLGHPDAVRDRADELELIGLLAAFPPP
jgi:hypothetical protein